MADGFIGDTTLTEPAFPLHVAAGSPVPEAHLEQAYRIYYGSGLYQSRYPGPNPRTLRRVLAELGRRGRLVLDFGCGSGRYAAPIAQRADATVIAYDPCEVALAQLRRRHGDLVDAGRVVPVGGGIDALGEALDRSGVADVALLAFGVLGHVAGAERRRATLRAVAAMVRPGGSVLLGLPNIRRRFRHEQRRWPGAEPGDVTYVRHSSEGPVRLFYHLYEHQELLRDLAAAGLVPMLVEAESVLPERLVASRRGWAAVDRLLAPVTPLGLAYGFLATAERPPAG